MADKTPIEWTDATWNPIRARNIATGGVGHFCVHVSDGCRNCYAERMQPRFRNAIRFAAQDAPKVEIFLDEAVLTQPLRRKRPRKIFVCSMTDLFGDWVTDAMLDRVFAVMALCPQHTFQIVTKRPERMRAWMLEKWQPAKAHTIEMGRLRTLSVPAETEGEDRHDQVLRECEHFLDEFKLADTENDKLWTEDGSLKCTQFKWPLPNVWLGVSVEDQKTADQRIPILLDTPAAIRFISAEPLLGPIDLKCVRNQLEGESFETFNALHKKDNLNLGRDRYALDWVIAGGESGPNARPSHPEWFRSLRDQCQAAGVAFLFKQWGEFAPCDNRSHASHVIFSETGVSWPNDRWRIPELWTPVDRVGKKAAGRQLDGRTWDEYPA